MVQVNKIADQQKLVVEQATNMDKKQKEMDALGYDPVKGAEMVKKCEEKEEEATKKKEEEEAKKQKGKEESKENVEPEKEVKDKSKKTRSEDKPTVLLFLADDECKTNLENGNKYDALKADFDKFESKKTSLEDDLKKMQAKLPEMNPGLNPATIDYVTERLMAEKLLFLIPEVVATSDQFTFEQFIKRLDKENIRWLQLKKLDQAEAEKDNDKKALYVDRVKADENAWQVIITFINYLKNDIVAKMKSEGADFKFPTTAFEKAQMKYYNDQIKASLAQAETLKAIDKDDADKLAKINTFIKDFGAHHEKGKEIQKKVVQREQQETEDADGNGNLLVIGLVLAVITIFLVIGICKCRKGKTEQQERQEELNEKLM